MSHFCFLMLPEPGHILPTLRVAKTLEGRGHSVSYASIYAGQVFLKRHAINCCRILQGLFPADSTDFPPSFVFRHKLIEYALQTKRTLSQLVASELLPLDFDTLLCDSKIVDCCGATLVQSLRRRVIALQSDLPDASVSTVDGIPKIILCPEELHMPHERFLRNNERTLYAEPSVFRDRNGEAAGTRAPIRNLVYCSLGTQSLRYRDRFPILKSAIAAFAYKPFHLLVHANSDCTALRSTELPPNVEVVETAQQLDLLADARLFITHGGLGGLKEAVMAGVPSLVIPFDFDQPLNAARVHHHKLGAYCSRSQCRAQQIWRLAMSLLEDSSVKQSVATMRHIFWRYEDEAPAVDFILRESSFHPQPPFP